MGCGQISRRQVLVFGAGAALLGVAPGCAVLRGGARHEVLAMSRASLEADVLRVPLEELAKVDAGEVLEVQPGGTYAPLVIAKGPSPGIYAVVTAACPHRGCTVDFDASVGGWECPCHGSRFAIDGALLEGPADAPLIAPPSRIEAGALVVDLSGAKKPA